MAESVETEAKLAAFAARSLDKRFAAVVKVHTQRLQRGHGCAWGLGDEYTDLHGDDEENDDEDDRDGLEDAENYGEDLEEKDCGSTTPIVRRRRKRSIERAGGDETAALLPRTDQRVVVKIGKVGVTAVPETILTTVATLLSGVSEASMPKLGLCNRSRRCAHA